MGDRRNVFVYETPGDRVEPTHIQFRFAETMDGVVILEAWEGMHPAGKPTPLITFDRHGQVVFHRERLWELGFRELGGNDGG